MSKVSQRLGDKARTWGCQATCLLCRALSSLLHSQHQDDKGTKLVFGRWEIRGSPETADTVDKQCRGFLRKEGPPMRERLELLLRVWRACILPGGALPLPTCTSPSWKFPSCLRRWMKAQEGSSGLGLWLPTSSRLEGSCSQRPGFGMVPPPWTLCQGSSCAQGSHPHNKPARVVVLIPQFTDEETGAQRGKTTCPKSLNKNCSSKGHHMGRQESTCPRARAPYMRGPGAPSTTSMSYVPQGEVPFHFRNREC